MKKSDLINSVNAQLKKNRELEKEYARYVQLGLIGKGDVDIERFKKYNQSLLNSLDVLKKLPEEEPSVPDNVVSSDEIERIAAGRAAFKINSSKIRDLINNCNRLMEPVVLLNTPENNLLINQNKFNTPKQIEILEKAENIYQLNLEGKNATVNNARELLQDIKAADIKKFLKTHSDSTSTIRTLSEEIKDLVTAIANKEYLPKNQVKTGNYLAILTDATYRCHTDVELLSARIAILNEQVTSIRDQIKHNIETDIAHYTQNFNFFYDDIIKELGKLEGISDTRVDKTAIQKLKIEFDETLESRVSSSEQKLEKLGNLYKELTDKQVVKQKAEIPKVLNKNISTLESSRSKEIDTIVHKVDKFRLARIDQESVDKLVSFKKWVEIRPREPNFKGLSEKYSSIQALDADLKVAVHAVNNIAAAYDKAVAISRKPEGFIEAVNTYEHGVILLRALGQLYEKTPFLNEIDEYLGSFNAQGLKNIKEYIDSENSDVIKKKLVFIEVLSQKGINYKPFLNEDLLINAVIQMQKSELVDYITQDTLNNGYFLKALKILNDRGINPHNHLETLLKDSNKCEIICQQQQLNDTKEKAQKRISQEAAAAAKPFMIIADKAGREADAAAKVRDRTAAAAELLIKKAIEARALADATIKVQDKSQIAIRLKNANEAEAAAGAKLQQRNNANAKVVIKLKEESEAQAKAREIQAPTFSQSSLLPLAKGTLQTLLLDFLKTDQNVSRAINIIRKEISPQEEPDNDIDNGTITINNDCHPALLVLVNQPPQRLQKLINDNVHGKNNVHFLKGLFQTAGYKTHLVLDDNKPGIIDASHLNRLLDKNTQLLTALEQANQNPKCEMAKVAEVMKAINQFVTDNRQPLKHGTNSQKINNTLESFRNDSIKILLSDKNLKTKKAELERSAKTHFDPHATKHLLLDILQCITLAFLVIMPVRIFVQNQNAFFSTAPNPEKEKASELVKRFKEITQEERDKNNPEESIESTKKKI